MKVFCAKKKAITIGTVKMTFLGQYTKFENYIPEMYIND